VKIVPLEDGQDGVKTVAWGIVEVVVELGSGDDEVMAVLNVVRTSVEVDAMFEETEEPGTETLEELDARELEELAVGEPDGLGVNEPEELSVAELDKLEVLELGELEELDDNEEEELWEEKAEDLVELAAEVDKLCCVEAVVVDTGTEELVDSVEVVDVLREVDEAATY
jgi:hypothetical protein